MQIAQTNLGSLEPPVVTDYTEGVTQGEQVLSTTEALISRGIGYLTVLAALFFVVFFVLGAFKWAAAGGESGKVQKARDQMIQGVLGMVLVVAAYAVIGVIGTILGINILQPAALLSDLIP